MTTDNFAKDYVNPKAAEKDLIPNLLDQRGINGIDREAQTTLFGLESNKISIGSTGQFTSNVHPKMAEELANSKITVLQYTDKNNKKQSYSNAKDLRDLSAKFHEISKDLSGAPSTIKLDKDTIQIGQDAKQSTQKILSTVEDLAKSNSTPYQQVLDIFQDGIEKNQKFLNSVKEKAITVQEPAQSKVINMTDAPQKLSNVMILSEYSKPPEEQAKLNLTKASLPEAGAHKTKDTLSAGEQMRYYDLKQKDGQFQYQSKDGAQYNFDLKQDKITYLKDGKPHNLRKDEGSFVVKSRDGTATYNIEQENGALLYSKDGVKQAFSQKVGDLSFVNSKGEKSNLEQTTGQFQYLDKNGTYKDFNNGKELKEKAAQHHTAVIDLTKAHAGKYMEPEVAKTLDASYKQDYTGLRSASAGEFIKDQLSVGRIKPYAESLQSYDKALENIPKMHETLSNNRSYAYVDRLNLDENNKSDLIDVVSKLARGPAQNIIGVKYAGQEGVDEKGFEKLQKMDKNDVKNHKDVLFEVHKDGQKIGERKIAPEDFLNLVKSLDKSTIDAAVKVDLRIPANENSTRTARKNAVDAKIKEDLGSRVHFGKEYIAIDAKPMSIQNRETNVAPKEKVAEQRPTNNPKPGTHRMQPAPNTPEKNAPEMRTLMGTHKLSPKDREVLRNLHTHPMKGSDKPKSAPTPTTGTGVSKPPMGR
jgi:hypothetical protein